jgi:CubicO group peptidase (beta-lactamase class C family)
VLALVLASTATTREEPVPPVGPSPEAIIPADPPDDSARPLEVADVKTWLDGFMPYALQSGDVAGAVVTVVEDGKVLVLEGYGYADVEKRVTVDPEKTLVRPGSVSKLFTWTAVMQLVEQGSLDLDEDVNAYLDFRIRPYEGKPVTLRNVMTHTAGFEEAFRRLITPDIENVGPRENAQTLDSRTCLRAGLDAVLLELCDGACGIHRRARLGKNLRRVYRTAYLRSSRDAPIELPPAAAG